MKKNRVRLSRAEQRGQILLETIAALGILIMGVFAVVGMSLTTARSANVSSNRIVAVNLAREGLELVRLVRDTNWLDPNAVWPYGLLNGSYTIDSESGDALVAVVGSPASVQECGSACALYLDAQGRYTHTPTSQSTSFSRLVIIQDAGGLETKRVLSEVYWSENGRSQRYIVETHLSNWRPE